MESTISFKKALIIGASRGLGRAVALYAPTQLTQLESLTLVSRKTNKLGGVVSEVCAGDRPNRLPFRGDVQALTFDVTQGSAQESVKALIAQGDFDLVVYCAGGGPHGEFSSKDWKDHLWSFHVNFLAPILFVHEWLRARPKESRGRFIIVGSRIAEKSPDPLAASYAAGKHGILGFVSSLQSELENSGKTVWLFSPGYMDSEMLPANAKVRHDGIKLLSVETAAQALLRWIRTDGPWHRVL